MYVRQNVVKPLGKSPGAAAPKEPNVTIVAVDDILTWPLRDDKGVAMLGSFVMKDNAKMISVYMTPSKIKATFESDGDEDSVSIMQKFEGESPGNELELAEFVQNWIGVNAIIIYGSCVDSYRKVMGTKCAPMQLKPSLEDGNDARKHMLVFEQFAKSGFVPGHYTGSLSFAAPFEVVSAGAVIVNETNGRIYKLPSTAAATPIVFSTIALNHGDEITLIGGGGSTAATLVTGVTDKSALLINGTTWVALDGAVINLKVFKNGAITLLQEVSRA